MPSVDESQQERQTYGNSAGWSQDQREKAPKEPTAPIEDAAGASSPPDAATAPSAEPSQEQVSEQGPPPTTPPEPEKKFHMPPEQRWEELRQQRDAERQRAEKAEQLAQLALQKLQTPQAPVVQQEDHWKGLVDHPDPATAQFYQQQRALFQREAEHMADQKLQGVLQAVDAGRRELASIKITQFRRENPDIKPGSTEELAIAGYVQQGMELETAKKLALYDKLESENRVLKSKQASVPQKRAAAQVESSTGIPQTAGLPPKTGDWRERAGEVLDKGGGMRDVLGIVFGGRKP